jgi:hypothetical protein
MPKRLKFLFSITFTTFVSGQPMTSGGLNRLAPDNLSSLAKKHEIAILTGSRTTPMIAHNIELNDDQTGPVSRRGVSTASSASYGLSIIGKRPSWNTSSITGEMDGLSVFMRQANGDTASILSNVGVRSGYAATLESSTYSMDSTGAVIRGVNTQIGVVNPRDGGEYGFIANAANHTNLTAAFRAANLGTANWADFFQAVNSSGTVLSRVDGNGGVSTIAIVASRSTPAPTNTTGTCPTVGAITGGNLAGAFRTTSACPISSTIKLVFNYSAPAGWVCNFQDTSSAATFRETAYNKTSCTVTVTGATHADDEVVFTGTAF